MLSALKPSPTNGILPSHDSTLSPDIVFTQTSPSPPPGHRSGNHQLGTQGLDLLRILAARNWLRRSFQKCGAAQQTRAEKADHLIASLPSSPAPREQTVVSPRGVLRSRSLGARPSLLPPRRPNALVQYQHQQQQRQQQRGPDERNPSRTTGPR